MMVFNALYDQIYLQKENKADLEYGSHGFHSPDTIQQTRRKTACFQNKETISNRVEIKRQIYALFIHSEKHVLLAFVFGGRVSLYAC